MVPRQAGDVTVSCNPPAQSTGAAAAGHSSPWHPRSSVGRTSDTAPRWPAVHATLQTLGGLCAGSARPAAHLSGAVEQEKSCRLANLGNKLQLAVVHLDLQHRMDLSHSCTLEAACTLSAGPCPTLTRCSRMMSLASCSLGSASLSGAKQSICTLDAYSGCDPLPSTSSSAGSDRVTLLT